MAGGVRAGGTQRERERKKEKKTVAEEQRRCKAG